MFPRRSKKRIIMTELYFHTKDLVSIRNSVVDIENNGSSANECVDEQLYFEVQL